jgi:hypothetical protein
LESFGLRLTLFFAPQRGEHHERLLQLLRLLPRARRLSAPTRAAFTVSVTRLAFGARVSDLLEYLLFDANQGRVHTMKLLQRIYRAILGRKVGRDLNAGIYDPNAGIHAERNPSNDYPLSIWENR